MFDIPSWHRKSALRHKRIGMQGGVYAILAGSLVAARVSSGKQVPRVTVVEIVAFVFAMFTLYGCGAEPVHYGLVLLLLGIPVFVWQRRRTGVLAE